MKRVAASTIALALIAAGLLTVSSPSCSCIEPPMEFGWELNMVAPLDYTGAGDLSAKAVEAAATKKYIGKSLKDVAPPTALRQGGCKRSGVEMTCRYEVASGAARTIGLLIRFSEDEMGRVKTVHVEEFTKWFWQS